MARLPYQYRVFGLNIESAYLLPELAAGPEGAAVDVVISTGKVASGVAPIGSPQPIPGGTLLEIGGVARYAVTGGSSIIVDAEPGTPERNIRLYLLGSALGLLVHQRGLLPLHASVVEVAGHACAFMGHSGSGKSTLAVACFDRGHRVIADDVCVVRFGEGGLAQVSPGIPRLRLWQDALGMTGRDPARYPRAYAGDDEWNKFDVALDATAHTNANVPLTAIYLLTRAKRFGLSPLSPIRAVEAIIANTYRGEYVSISGHVKAHWEACLRLSTSAPVFQCARTFKSGNFDGEIDGLLDHVRTYLREQLALV